MAALKFSSEGMIFLVNLWAEEQQLYKTEVLYLYLIDIYKILVPSINLFPKSKMELGEHLFREGITRWLLPTSFF